MCTTTVRESRSIRSLILPAAVLYCCAAAPLSAGAQFGPAALPPATVPEQAERQPLEANPTTIEPDLAVEQSSGAAPAHERIPLGKPAKADPLSITNESPTKSLISPRSAASLGLVLALVFILKFVLTRSAKSSGSFSSRFGAGGRAPSGVLEVLGRYPVARGITLVLLRLDRRILLLSQSPEGFSTLAQLTDPDDIASILTKTRDDDGESISSKFTAMLKRFERDHTIIEEPIEIPESPIAARHNTPYVRAGDISADDIQTHLARIRELQG